jgi:hypothetical protein
MVVFSEDDQVRAVNADGTTRWSWSHAGDGTWLTADEEKLQHWTR